MGWLHEWLHELIYYRRRRQTLGEYSIIWTAIQGQFLDAGVKEADQRILERGGGQGPQ